MGSYIKRVTARRCAVHQAVLDKAKEHLVSTGVFSKNEVLSALSMTAVEDSIRWDYIAGFIEEDERIKLVPLAQSYFKRRQDDRELTGKFIAGGNSKRTAGYASVDLHDGKIARILLERKVAMTNGVGRAMRDLGEALHARGELTDGELKALESKVSHTSVLSDRSGDRFLGKDEAA